MASIPVEQIEDSTSETVEQASTPPTKRHLKKRHVIIGVVIVLFVATAAYLVIDRMRLAKEVDKLSHSQSVSAENEAVQLTNEVAKLIELPTDESPTIATVADASKVKDKQFFAHAQNGDKVLIFAKSGKAMLYRPSTHKLVEVSALSLSDTQTTGGVQSTTQTNR